MPSAFEALTAITIELPSYLSPFAE
jgi:hypothetical protein